MPGLITRWPRCVAMYNETAANVEGFDPCQHLCTTFAVRSSGIISFEIFIATCSVEALGLHMCQAKWGCLLRQGNFHFSHLHST